MPEILVHPFPPLYDEESRVLILGSFPSVVSRKKAFYYANPGNRFWRVLAAVFEEEIKDRRTFCLEHHIALWDVIASCSIHGSSDASIDNVTVNDIGSLVAKTKIRHIFATGKKAAGLYSLYIHEDIPFTGLPSTSGANASYHLEDLINAYRIIRTSLEEA
ncbi:MAG: DNA-deoxyinosine glycosylase [Solobacterium sp.]|nr:DNA-deoxyinosine glycosylase [Solobacterium sp.]